MDAVVITLHVGVQGVLGIVPPTLARTTLDLPHPSPPFSCEIQFLARTTFSQFSLFLKSCCCFIV